MRLLGSRKSCPVNSVIRSVMVTEVCFIHYTQPEFKPIFKIRFMLSKPTMQAGILGVLAFSGCAGEPVLQKPNVVIIIADDAGWNDFGAYGNPGVRTPNIDRLAAEGMLFTNAFVTTSSCSPSRASILTGMYPHNTGAQELHMPLPADRNLFAGTLQKAGYYTVASGKWHIGPKRAEFDSIYDVRDPSGAADWIRALENRPPEKPFFMWFAAVDPHRPYQENIIDRPHQLQEVVVPPFLPDNEFTRKDLALYYDELARLDFNVGKVLDELDRQGVAENTMVIFMTDNGRPFPRCKTRMLDDGLKSPFIIRWPAVVQAGSASGSLISSVDIAPTICELAGADALPQFQGVSFVPVLKDPGARVRDFVVGEHNWHDYQAHERSVRTSRYLYIRNAWPQFNANPPADAAGSITFREMVRLYRDGSLAEPFLDCFTAPRQAEELYDLSSDPLQLNNRAYDAQYADALRNMQRILDQWITETNDSVPAIPTPDMFDRWTGKKLMDIQEYRKTLK